MSKINRLDLNANDVDDLVGTTNQVIDVANKIPVSFVSLEPETQEIVISRATFTEETAPVVKVRVVGDIDVYNSYFPASSLNNQVCDAQSNNAEEGSDFFTVKFLIDKENGRLGKAVVTVKNDRDASINAQFHVTVTE